MEEEIKIDDDFILIRFQNNTDEVAVFQRPIQLGLIQFHFGLKGSANYNFNQGNYSLKLKEEKAYKQNKLQLEGVNDKTDVTLNN